MKLTLRLITIACYFLPCIFFFTKCTGGLQFSVAYNQEEADKNALLENESLTAATDTTKQETLIANDSIKSEVVSQSIFSDNIFSDSSGTSATLGDKALRMILMPTNTSVSGIGCVFIFKNLTGIIAISISILISLTLAILFKFLKSKKVTLYLLLAGIFSFLIFIIDCFISNITLLWGAWTLLALLLFQFFLEVSDQKKAYR